MRTRLAPLSTPLSNSRRAIGPASTTVRREATVARPPSPHITVAKTMAPLRVVVEEEAEEGVDQPELRDDRDRQHEREHELDLAVVGRRQVRV